MTISRQKILLIVVFVIASTVILLNRFTALYINNSTVHLIFLFLATGSFAVAVVHYVFKHKSVRATMFTLVLVAAACAAKAFFTWGGDWKTQTIVYKNLTMRSHTIEIQMRGDRFTFGYRKRMIDRQQLLPYFDIIKDVDTTKLDPATWYRVDEKVNQIELPGQ